MIGGAIRLFCVAICASLMAAAAWSAPAGDVAPAPVPSAVLAAKKVFLSNLGSDVGALEIIKWTKTIPGVEFDQFYAALKTWGHYQLVDSPAESDVVFTFGVETGTVVGAQVTSLILRLRIVDTKTGFVLSTMNTSPIVYGRNFNDELAASTIELVNSLKALAPPAAAGATG